MNQSLVSKWLRRALLVGTAMIATQVAANSEVEVTIASSDFRSVLTQAEVQRLEEINDELRELRDIAKTIPKESGNYQSLLMLADQKKDQRDEEFAHIKGLGGQTITLVGNPPPTKEQVLNQVVSARRAGLDAPLHSYWHIGHDGALVGGATAPVIEAAEDQPTMPVVLAEDLPDIKPVSRVYVADAKECRGSAPASGFVCLCDPTNDVFGIPSGCWWGLPP